MAYNQPYGMPYGYGAYPYGQIQQPQQPVYTQPQVAPQNNQAQPNQQAGGNFYAIVNGLEGAKAYQVLPNQTILLMDSNKPILYNKSANGLGQVNLECFKLVQIKESDINTAQTENLEKSAEFALKDDVILLSKRLDALNSRFDKLVVKPKENKGGE